MPVGEETVAPEPLAPDSLSRSAARAASASSAATWGTEVWFVTACAKVAEIGLIPVSTVSKPSSAAKLPVLRSAPGLVAEVLRFWGMVSIIRMFGTCISGAPAGIFIKAGDNNSGSVSGKRKATSTRCSGKSFPAPGKPAILSHAASSDIPAEASAAITEISVCNSWP